MNLAEKTLRLFGWRVIGEKPDLKKAVIVMAPHTSYWDAVIGKLVLLSYGVKHKLLSKKELFVWPLSWVFRLFGMVPIRGLKGKNSVFMVADMLERADELFVVICPEGGFAPTDHWSTGFIYMARRAEVPVIVAYVDYKYKTAGMKSVIYDLSDEDTVISRLAKEYADVNAKYPSDFVLPKTGKERQAARQKGGEA